MACAPSEDSAQPGHPPSLIRVFAVRVKKAWVLSYPLSAQQRLWSDWADAQADLSLRWAHSHFVGFVMLWLMLLFVAWITKKDAFCQVLNMLTKYILHVNFFHRHKNVGCKVNDLLFTCHKHCINFACYPLHSFFDEYQKKKGNLIFGLPVSNSYADTYHLAMFDVWFFHSEVMRTRWRWTRWSARLLINLL